MDKITCNEFFSLDNGSDKVFYSFNVLPESVELEYVYMISNSKPVEIRIARQRVIDDECVFEIVDNRVEILHALRLFQEDHKASHPDGADNLEESERALNAFLEQFQDENFDWNDFRL